MKQEKEAFNMVKKTIFKGRTILNKKKGKYTYLIIGSYIWSRIMLISNLFIKMIHPQTKLYLHLVIVMSQTGTKTSRRLDKRTQKEIVSSLIMNEPMKRN